MTRIVLKTGDEKFAFEDSNIQHYLIDFWKWSVSDLLSNATRGRLAEFIVATAIGYDTDSVRAEWDDYDLLTAQGIKIEVKSAAFIQSWEQARHSAIRFNIKAGKERDEITGRRTSISVRHAHVYVLCLLKHKDRATIDPMKLEQWEFYVVATKILNEYAKDQVSIGLRSVRRFSEPVEYTQLKSAIEFAAKQ